MERRKSERVRCRIACRIESGREACEGLVLDMSQGGLCVRSPRQASQGDAVRVVLKMPRGPLDVEALVWHSRLVRQRGTKDASWILGLMLSKARSAYYDLVPDGDPQRERTARQRTDGPSGKEAAADDADLPSFRIRVKQRGGPRTRVLALNARSEDEARSLSVADLGDEWEILEVCSA